MREILKNPFFIAVAFAGVVATTCALLTIVYTDAGSALLMWIAILVCTLIPSITVALIVNAVMRENARLSAEQATEPRFVLRKRYKDQMVVSLVAPAIEGGVATIILYLTGNGAAYRILMIFAILAVIFSPYFFQCFLGWWRNR